MSSENLIFIAMTLKINIVQIGVQSGLWLCIQGGILLEK